MPYVCRYEYYLLPPPLLAEAAGPAAADFLAAAEVAVGSLLVGSSSFALAIMTATSSSFPIFMVCILWIAARSFSRVLGFLH